MKFESYQKDLYSSNVYLSSLTVQPMNRCLNRNKLYEDKRYFVQIKWYNIADEIIENMNANLKTNIEKLPS